MSKKTILCVDDEDDILELLSLNLLKEGYEVYTATNGDEAIDLLNTIKPDLIVLDIMMPEKDGLETCKYIRNHPDLKDIYIFFLTAKTDEIDEILGLEVGADDYISKPFSPRKIVTKVKALFRRTGKDATVSNINKDIIKVRGVEINRLSYTVKVDGKEVKFLHKEFELLYFLMKRPDVVYSRNELLNNVWDENAYFIDRTVDVHVTKIRKKLGAYAKYIKTVSGVGYKFTESE